MCIVLLCVYVSVAVLLARSQYSEGPATGHLIFSLSKSEYSDGPQNSKLLLHASHVALRLKFLRSLFQVHVHAL